jgi:AcrR family transcriptional regulator
MDVKAARAPGRRTTRLGAPRPTGMPEKITTKDLLIEKAESLFARHGLDGISLREIAMAAGQSSNNAVQYHFKDKAGLVRAILDDRVRRTEAFRRACFETLAPEKHTDPRELLKILWCASLVIRSDDGGHPYCRFFLQYTFQPQITQHPIFTTIEGNGTGGPAGPRAEKNFPYSIKTGALLRQAYEQVPRKIYSYRLSVLGIMFLSAVAAHDNAGSRSRKKKIADFDVEPLLDIALAALAAPF